MLTRLGGAGNAVGGTLDLLSALLGVGLLAVGLHVGLSLVAHGLAPDISQLRMLLAKKWGEAPG